MLQRINSLHERHQECRRLPSQGCFADLHSTSYQVVPRDLIEKQQHWASGEDSLDSVRARCGQCLVVALDKLIALGAAYLQRQVTPQSLRGDSCNGREACRAGSRTDEHPDAINRLVRQQAGSMNSAARPVGSLPSAAW